jgi:hypothetical protein
MSRTARSPPVPPSFLLLIDTHRAVCCRSHSGHVLELTPKSMFSSEDHLIVGQYRNVYTPVAISALYPFAYNDATSVVASYHL